MSDEPSVRKRNPARRQAALSMRIAPATRDELVERAASSGRSVTQEADRLLQHGLIISKMMPGSAPMLQVLMEFDRAGSRIASERGLEGEWWSDADCYMAAASAAIHCLIRSTPGPWDAELWHTWLENNLLSVDNMKRGLAGRFIADEGQP